MIVEQARLRSTDRLAARWATLGAMFNVRAANGDIDLERLLIDSARESSTNDRLFLMAVTWLAVYGRAVARDRLAQLIADEMERDHWRTMGLMLETAEQKSVVHRLRFSRAIALCERDLLRFDAGRALSDAVETSDVWRTHLQRQASDLSRKWGRWIEEFDLKLNALRPANWIMERNPQLQTQLLLGGDVAASILAECRARGGEVESESHLIRHCGVSRPAVHRALERLVAAQQVKLVDMGRATRVQLASHAHR